MPEIKMYSTANPPAGEPIPDIVVPSGEVWQIQSVQFSFVIGGSTVDRVGLIQVFDASGGNSFLWISSGYIVTIIGENVVYTFGGGLTFSNVKVTNRYISAPLPVNLTLDGDWKMQVGTDGGNIADNFSKATVGYFLL